MSASNWRDNLYIEIDSFFVECILVNDKNYTLDEVKTMYQNALSLSKVSEDLPDIMCKLYKFKKISFDFEIERDWIIDDDIQEVYSPKFGYFL